MSIPENEFDSLIQDIRSHAEYYDPAYVLAAYRKHDLDIIPDPFSPELVRRVKQALLNGVPLSVVRVGDSEANLISYDANSSTPFLNRHVVESSISRQKDSFEVDLLWMVTLRELLMGAVMQADIVGVIGLWRPTIHKRIQYFKGKRENVRGFCGQWRAVNFMLGLAEKGILDNKVLASAHLYFSLLEYLNELLGVTKKVFLISDRKAVAGKLRQKYPAVEFVPIDLVRTRKQPKPEGPHFLAEVYSALPGDMHGSLSLVGAGPWAEIYCTWIKQRGSVAVDIGSGFDLLDGDATRPVHKKIGLERARKYAI